MTPRRVNLVLLAAAIATVAPLLSRAAPDFFNEARALTLAKAVAVAAAAISLNMLMGYAGQISLGHYALLGVGGFSSGIVVTRGFELPMFPFGFLVAGLLGTAVALMLGLPALRLRGLYLAMVTIAFGLAMEESFFQWSPITGGSAGIEVPRSWLFGEPLSRNADYLALMGLVLMLMWLLDVNVLKTKLGRAFLAIKSDELVAQSFGIDVARYKLYAFLISGALAGVSGAMLGHLLGFVDLSSFTYGYSLFLVVIVVVGGLGNRAGVVMAAFFFAIMERVFQLDSLKFLDNFDQIIGAALLIHTMVRHPSGLAGAMREAREKKAEAAARKADVQADEPTLPRLTLPSIAPKKVPEGSILLEARGVSVSFGGLKAVDNVDLDVHSGQIVGLIGPNGAGKTTFFNAISGFIRPDAGQVRLLGQDISDLPPHERVGLGMGRTFQLIGLAKELSVLDNFLLSQHLGAEYSNLAALTYLKKASVTEEELQRRGETAIEALGFSKYRDTPVRNLSHGQQRLVELGCALMSGPELLLLDEPSAGFSPAAVENLTERLRDLRSSLGRTVLLIEHNIPMVLALCDYIYVLNFGQVLAHGTRDDIASHPEVIAAYFGEGHTADTASAR